MKFVSTVLFRRKSYITKINLVPFVAAWASQPFCRLSAVEMTSLTCLFVSVSCLSCLQLQTKTEVSGKESNDKQILTFLFNNTLRFFRVVFLVLLVLKTKYNEIKGKINITNFK